MRKMNDFQPYLDYFEMLKSYEQNGFLDVQPAKHESFITLSALHAMSDGDNPIEQLENNIPDTVRRLHVYAAFCARRGDVYMQEEFAVHVVKDKPPHDLLYTILLSRRRRWFCPWHKRESIEVIEYTK